MLARHLVNVQTEQGLDHWPNLYCGTAVIDFLSAVFGLPKDSPAGENCLRNLACFYSGQFCHQRAQLYLAWFHYPNSLPCRQSFIYIALMLLVCYRAYMYLETPLKHVGMALWELRSLCSWPRRW